MMAFCMVVDQTSILGGHVTTTKKTRQMVRPGGIIINLGLPLKGWSRGGGGGGRRVGSGKVLRSSRTKHLQMILVNQYIYTSFSLK